MEIATRDADCEGDRGDQSEKDIGYIGPFGGKAALADCVLARRIYKKKDAVV